MKDVNQGLVPVTLVVKVEESVQCVCLPVCPDKTDLDVMN